MLANTVTVASDDPIIIQHGWGRRRTSSYRCAPGAPAAGGSLSHRKRPGTGAPTPWATSPQGCQGGDPQHRLPHLSGVGRWVSGGTIGGPDNDPTRPDTVPILGVSGVGCRCGVGWVRRTSFRPSELLSCILLCHPMFGGTVFVRRSVQTHPTDPTTRHRHIAPPSVAIAFR